MMVHIKDDCIWRGERVQLRAFEPSDWEVVHGWDLDSENQHMSYHIPFPQSNERQRKWAEETSVAVPQNDQFRFAIENHQMELVGTINTHSCDRRNGTFKYGLGIGKEHRRKGYASEAILLVLRYFFAELRYQKVTVHVYSFNEASIRLHEKLGFKHEGCLRSMVYTAGEYWDEVIFGLTVEEWKRLISPA